MMIRVSQASNEKELAVSSSQSALGASSTVINSVVTFQLINALLFVRNDREISISPQFPVVRKTQDHQSPGLSPARWMLAWHCVPSVVLRSVRATDRPPAMQAGFSNLSGLRMRVDAMAARSQHDSAIAGVCRASINKS